MQDNLKTTVGLLVAQQPLRAQVFDRFKIDYCCGGKQTLETVCVNNKIDSKSVLTELEVCDNMAKAKDRPESWLDATLTELADHIEATHHAYLREELPRLQALADKVAKVHGQNEPQMSEVATVFASLKQEIEPHTIKEESVLFPFIRQLDKNQTYVRPPFGTVVNPIECMDAEHALVGEALGRLQELTHQYTAPDHACGSWRALIGGLAHLDQDLRTHIHKESSILFPKAIEAEQYNIKSSVT